MVLDSYYEFFFNREREKQERTVNIQYLSLYIINIFLNTILISIFSSQKVYSTD